ncbi:transmembrane protein, putative (macronuclear) [Tetrahymena thermophila SB210]|uniref:Transmembrane protein, putative n=1 Tax=Tetrahymena thermophila (strain SB210) TaxID=312017 RepID=W7X4U1_TETTS|nr:transmembrane protein, putative [Tetrahymena thermophila SB210]EWS71388.1 transmembrane protein, putative [Tetrahymena thermophila SB210]|eukprot:XP_012656089.1 transmembrane protein, putative [Tetrahymena thermophila SB210]
MYLLFAKIFLPIHYSEKQHQFQETQKINLSKMLVNQIYQNLLHIKDIRAFSPFQLTKINQLSIQLETHLISLTIYVMIENNKINHRQCLPNDLQGSIQHYINNYLYNYLKLNKVSKKLTINPFDSSININLEINLKSKLNLNKLLTNQQQKCQSLKGLSFLNLIQSQKLLYTQLISSSQLLILFICLNQIFYKSLYLSVFIHSYINFIIHDKSDSKFYLLELFKFTQFIFHFFNAFQNICKFYKLVSVTIIFNDLQLQVSLNEQIKIRYQKTKAFIFKIAIQSVTKFLFYFFSNTKQKY